MTISSETSRMDNVGNGATLIFPYTYKINASSHMVVVVAIAGVEYTLAEITDYTVSGVGLSAGGNVTFVVAPANGTKITLRRVIPLLQNTDIKNQATYFPETHEDVFDYLTTMVQQLKEISNRSLTLSVTSSGVSAVLPSPVANQFLGWNAAATALINYAGVAGVPVSTFMATVLDDVDASAAQTTLGISTFIKTLLDDANVSAAQTTLGISAFIKTLLDDVDAPAAQTTLGISAFIKTLLDDADVSAAQTTLGIPSVMAAFAASNWAIRTSAADNQCNSVAFGAGLFVSVAASGVGNRVMTSPDGITWTIRTSAADNGWSSVIFVAGLFVAVAYSGVGNRVMTSPDGITWTIRTSAADNPWNSVAFGAGLFVAVASFGVSNRVMTSPDGITWTIRTSAADSNWNSITFGTGLFVAVSSSGASNRVMTSFKIS